MKLRTLCLVVLVCAALAVPVHGQPDFGDDRGFSESRILGQAKKPVAPASASTSVTFGSKRGAYIDATQQQIRDKPEQYVQEKVHVELIFEIAWLEKNSEMRIRTDQNVNFRSIDILVPITSPLYDQIVAYKPRGGLPMSIWGQVRRSSGDGASLYIRPDQITFSEDVPAARKGK